MDQHPAPVFTLGMDGTDCFGIVYFAQHWTWYQHALEHLLEGLGHPIRELIDDGIGLPMARGEIDYHAPVRLGDRVRVQLTPVRAGTRSLEVRARVVHEVSGDPVATLRVVHVLTGRDMAPIAMPTWLREAAAP